MSEIKKIEHIGTTGGIDGDYSYSFSDNQIVEFIDLLNQVELGGKVDENKHHQMELFLIIQFIL